MALAVDEAEGREADGPAATERDQPGDFMVLDLAAWDRIWRIETPRVFDHAVIYLALLQGTGKDHRISKWSARACKRHLGIPWPRAKKIIARLADEGLFEIGGTARAPRYCFPAPAERAPVVFLPNELVRARTPGDSLLVQLRKTRDRSLLHLLVTIYSLVTPDLTRSMPITAFRNEFAEVGDEPVGFLDEKNIWTVCIEDMGHVAVGDWTRPYRGEASPDDPDDPEGMDAFYYRLDALLQLGAVVIEVWLFDRRDLEADPLHPVDLGRERPEFLRDHEASVLTAPARDLVERLASPAEWLGGSWFAPDLYGEGPPRLLGVLRPRLLAQTEPMFDAARHRTEAVSYWLKIYGGLVEDARREAENVAIK